MSKQVNSPKPPYGSFKTTKSFIERLNNTVVPDVIDRSMMSGMSGDSQTETLSAFRFLGLLAPNDSVKAPLKSLVDAYGTDKWKQVLADTITRAYAPIIGDLNIETSTGKALADRFRDYGIDGFMLARCVRFFVAALKEAEVKHSPHFRAPRISAKTRTSKSKTRNNDRPKTATNNDNDGSKSPEIPAGYRTFPLPPDRVFHVPPDITKADVKFIAAVLEAYAERREVDG